MERYTEILKIVGQKKADLRHDVDVSLVSAYNISKIDLEFGIRSSFYIRFDCDYYNPFSIEGMKILKYIKENHEVGCHVDATDISDDSDLLEYLERYNRIFPFDWFTFHINTDKTKSFGHVGKFVNKSIIEGEYISDSKGILTPESIERINLLDEYTLVLHPEWWDNESMSMSTDRRKSIIESMRLDSLSDRVIKEILNI